MDGRPFILENFSCLPYNMLNNYNCFQLIVNLFDIIFTVTLFTNFRIFATIQTIGSCHPAFHRGTIIGQTTTAFSSVLFEYRLAVSGTSILVQGVLLLEPAMRKLTCNYLNGRR